MNDVKPGITTSEFWMTLVTALVALVNQVAGLNLSATTIAGMVVPVAVYVVSRFVVKASAGKSS